MFMCLTHMFVCKDIHVHEHDKDLATGNGEDVAEEINVLKITL